MPSVPATNILRFVWFFFLCCCCHRRRIQCVPFSVGLVVPEGNACWVRACWRSQFFLTTTDVWRKRFKWAEQSIFICRLFDNLRQTLRPLSALLADENESVFVYLSQTNFAVNRCFCSGRELHDRRLLFRWRKAHAATIRCDNSKGGKRVEDDVLKCFFSLPLFFRFVCGFLVSFGSLT